MLRIALKGVLARKARLLLTSIAVVIGTAFLSGASIFTATINRTFDNLFTDVFKEVDAFVRSPEVLETDFGGQERQRIPVEVADAVAKVPGVSSVAPNIQSFARIIGKNGKPVGSDGNGPPTFGSSVVDSPVDLWEPKTGRFPVNSSEVALDEASAKTAKYSLGDTVKVVAQGGSREFTLVGILSYGEVRSPGGATFALFDIQTATEFLGKTGFIDAVLVQGDGSLSDQELATKITSTISGQYKIETLTGAQITKETQDEIAAALSFLDILLKIFSGIALGVGCFVIYNVFAISAAQRQRENALLRALGASKKQVTGSMFIEAVMVGLVGSGLGLAGGIGLSTGLTALLKAVNVDIPSSGLVLESGTIITTIIVGMFVTLVSAIMPALGAGRVPPLAAMRETVLETAGAPRRRVIIGIVLMLVGAGFIGLVMADGDNMLLLPGILGIFAGVLTIGPAVARPVALTLGAPIARLRGISGAMARQNAARHPKRTARTSYPVLIGVALVTAVTALAASIQFQIRDVIGSTFVGDLTITTNSQGFGGLSPSLVDEVNTLEVVDTATSVGFVAVKVEGEGRFIRVTDQRTVADVFDLGFVAGSARDLTGDGILISKKTADEKNLTIGSIVNVTLADASQHPLKVQGIYTQDRLVQRYIVSRDLFVGSAQSRFDAAIFIKKASGVSEEEAKRELKQLVDNYGTGDLYTKSEFIDEQSGQVNQILGLIYGLLGLSIIIAIVGIIITLLLSVYERQREIGLLRAVGMTRSQVRTTVRWESVITSLLGAVTGLILGVGLGWVVILALRDQGISRFTLPVTSAVWILVLSFIVGVLAAAYPAYRANKVDVLEALTTT